MPKYFFEPDAKVGNVVTLSGEVAHHLSHVLRMGVGQVITLGDGAACDYQGTITAMGKNSVICKVGEPTPSPGELPVRITLFQSLPKGDKLELIIQKAVELGVHEIVPVATARSIVKVKGDGKKVERYQRIAQSAAEQSMRGIVPQVCPPVSFREGVKLTAEQSTTLVAYEGEKDNTLRMEVVNGAERIGLWIGPEGGFAPDEIETLVSAGGKTITLGNRILRTETAAIATIAQIAVLI